MSVATDHYRRDRVPVRTIATAIAMVLVTVLLLLVIREVSRVLTWIVVAVFFSVVLHPLVGWVDRRVTEEGGRSPRSWSSLRSSWHSEV
jgi:predicted PurR-regulated permease PerM